MITQVRLKPAVPSSTAMAGETGTLATSLASSGRGRAHARAVLAVVAGLTLLLAAPRAHATQPFIWDQDGNGIDDRVESVHLLGWSASFELSDTTLRQRIQVVREGAGLLFHVYVVWTDPPDSSDLATLALLGMPTLSRIRALPVSRTLATWPQVVLASQLTGVERVEAVPILYPGTHDGTAAIGVRDGSAKVFPAVASVAPDNRGHGVVMAFLDTGVNDAAEGTYPGHEALLGRCLGGAVFVTADSLTQTPPDGSVNPADHGGQATHSHATHVAAIACGAGSAGGFAAGVAPESRFVDVKVLNDAGSGVAVPEALDWCITNRARDWGSPDPSERGIDIVNLSLSSPDLSDGQDVASRLAARAVELGMVVVASMGNDGLAAHVPSPAGGDGVLAVGAWDVNRTPNDADDAWPVFNNTGPRAGDGDGDALDELKPDLLAPGVDVLSANGDVLTDGTRWQRLSGTSMAAAFVSGVCALMRERAPAASPATIAEWLRSSARRPLAGSPAGVAGADPRWRSTRGCGLVDAYAALLEQSAPAETQFRRVHPAAEDSTVRVTVWTAREAGASPIVLERAPDVAGVPGAFAAVDSLPATGPATLAGPVSVTPYSWVLPVPPSERGVRFWYRAASMVGGSRQSSPACPLMSPGGRRAATLELTLVHDAFDSDLTVSVRAGYVPDHGPVFPIAGTSEAVAVDWVNGTSVTGSQAWTFRIAIPEALVHSFLPAEPGRPWTLTVTEAGSPTRSGRVQDFRLTEHRSSGDVVSVGQPLPLQTIEGGSVEVWIPGDVTTAVDGMPIARGLRLAPNPARAGGSVRLTLPAGGGSFARVFDTAGRERARVALSRNGDELTGEWWARDRDGHALAPGVYLVRGERGPAARVVLLGP